MRIAVDLRGFPPLAAARRRRPPLCYPLTCALQLLPFSAKLSPLHARAATSLCWRTSGQLLLQALAAAHVWTQSHSGSLKSYQHYLIVCYRQPGNLVRFQKSAKSGRGGGLVGSSQGSRAASGPRKRAQGPPRTVKRVRDRDSEPCHGRPGLGIRVGIRWGSKGDPVRFEGIRASGMFKN